MMKGAAIVISAPSGAGKSTLCKMLREEFPDFGYSVSCTTRPMRPGETEGRDYFFISEQDFKKMRQSGGFAETAVVHGHQYGTPLAPVKTMLDAGQDLLFDIDVQGAAQLKASLPGAVFVFVLPPAMAELERRLRNRGSEADAAIRLRLANAAAEIREAFWYDAIIVNDDLQSAYAGLRAVYLAAKLAPVRNLRKLEELLDECGAING